MSSTENNTSLCHTVARFWSLAVSSLPSESCCVTFARVGGPAALAYAGRSDNCVAD